MQREMHMYYPGLEGKNVLLIGGRIAVVEVEAAS